MNRFAADHVAISHPQRVHFCILAGKTEATTVSLTSNKLLINNEINTLLPIIVYFKVIPE